MGDGEKEVVICMHDVKEWEGKSYPIEAMTLNGDQASIIGGAVDFIKELHLILHSLESIKQRKNLSPRPLLHSSPASESSVGFEHLKELGACSNSPIADVEAKISGSNIILRVISRRSPGQILKIICLLEKHSFEILHLNISSMDDTVLYSFVIKISLESQLCVEELTLEVQQSFC
ncbi:hypothetical protein GIB67_017746 [Kingdonia uniflora]|uniref:Transcription factor MUTE n=1 Tax=Kingdonia uniflora TaxID=39325 RepID=A0A7J7LQ23_9MAGN|nr:hypothetical protein GIB67_017746 [Kingdonia uniflora]